MLRMMPSQPPGGSVACTYCTQTVNEIGLLSARTAGQNLAVAARLTGQITETEQKVRA